MKVSLRAFVLIVLCLPPTGVFAMTSQETLREEAKIFENVIEQDRLDTATEILEEARESGEELFPEIRMDTVPAEDDTGPYVTFRFNGYPVALTDVPRTAWFAPYIRDVAGRGIVSGYRNVDGVPTGLFGPANNVTVGELAKMAIEAAGTDNLPCQPDALNVTASGSWAEPYISCAEKFQWSIYADGSVDIARPATRAEVVVTVLEAFAVSLGEMSATENVFSDVGAAVQYANAIETAARDGLVSGYADEAGNPTGLFGPGDPVKRAEIAKIISIALQLYQD